MTGNLRSNLLSAMTVTVGRYKQRKTLNLNVTLACRDQTSSLFPLYSTRWDILPANISTRNERNNTMQSSNARFHLLLYGGGGGLGLIPTHLCMALFSNSTYSILYRFCHQIFRKHNFVIIMFTWCEHLAPSMLPIELFLPFKLRAITEEL